MNEALEEHHVVHLLIAELKKMTAGDERFDAKFTVLAENVKHHIKEEEGEMFPQVEESDLDWAYLAEKATEARQHFSTKVARPTKQSGKARKAKRPHDKCTLQSLHKKGRPRMAINIGRQLLPASTIEGTAVQNAAGEDLGEINELMIDLEKGRIAYAVLSFGGFLGLGDKLYALPWEALNISPEGDVFILNVPRAKLDNAPGFDKDNWPDMADSSWGETVHTYYGYKPYW